MEIWGATVLRIWGSVSLQAVSAGQTASGWFMMGSIVNRGQNTDIAAGHPDPDYVSTNDDKYASWGGLNQWSTPITVDTQQPHLHRFVHAKRQYIRQPDDELIMAFKYNFGQAASTINYQMLVNVMVSLP